MRSKHYKEIKSFLITIIEVILLCISFPSYATDSTISYIKINNVANKDVEILITDNGDIFVPFKQLADIFQIEYEATKADKKITFKTFDGKDGLITPDGIYIDNELVSKEKPVFVNTGMLEGVINEAYIPSDIATLIMDAKIESDFETLTLLAQVERDIPILDQGKPEEQKDVGPHAYQNVISPEQRGKITLNTIGFQSNMQNDSIYTSYKDSNTVESDTFTGNTQGTFNGNIFGGKYRVESSAYHYEGNPFMFGGLTGTYRNSFKTKKQGKEYFYEIGKVRGISDSQVSLGTQIFGTQFWNYNNEKTRSNDMSGYVKPTSLVRVTINDQEPVMLSTYGGYYTLKDIQLPNTITYLKIEEVNEDGTVELISQDNYSIFGDSVPVEHESRATAFAGIWGYQNRLFREGSNVYKGNNKKLTGGIEHQYGYKDNITFKSKLAFDTIYDKAESTSIYKLPTNDSVLVSGVQKSSINSEGITFLNSIDWISKKNHSIKASFSNGVSYSKDVRDNSDALGYSLNLTGSYDKSLENFKLGILQPKRFNLSARAYNTSSDFYIASSDSAANSNRIGGNVNLGLSFNSTSVSSSIGRYISNYNHKYSGGSVVFDDLKASVATKIPYVADVRVRGNFRRGENNYGHNENYNFDASASRNIGRSLRLQVGRNETYYDTKYHAGENNNKSNYSKYDNDYAQLNIKLPRNWGDFNVKHSIINYLTSSYKNSYNMINAGYSFPTWKRFSLSVNCGYKYQGQRGIDIGASLSYHSKTGRTISLRYQYSQNGGYFIDNYYMPTTDRHSINFVLNDAFIISNHWLKSIGDENINKGIFEAVAYIDVNNNGKYDKKEDIPVKNVPVIMSWAGDANYTNRKGKVHSRSVEKGIYKVSVDMDNLPMTVAPKSNENITQTIKIDGGKTTKLEIPLASIVGSLYGKLKIADDFNRELNISDFIVIVLDFTGKEVAYSTVSPDGSFYISGLAPGTYTVKLDDSYVELYALELLPDKSEAIITIPPDYEELTEIKDIELEYRTL